MAFYRRVRPYGFWGPIARLCPDVCPTDRFLHDIVLFALGLAGAYSMLFCVAFLFLGDWSKMIVVTPVGIVSTIVLVIILNRRGKTETLD